MFMPPKDEDRYASNMEDRLAFCTLGMFIIDEIEYINGKVPEQKLIGGAGTYASVGARLAAGSANSTKIGWIVDVGSDFPPEFKVLLDTWHTSCLFRTDHNRLTTRAWNGYGPNEFRAFKYLTPKRRIHDTTLSNEQVLAESFHMVCSPERCMSLVQGILERRHRLNETLPRPIIVWEPIPDLCTPEELENLCRAASYVDIISPNADELAASFPLQSDRENRLSMVSKILGQRGDLTRPRALVIREGADGSTAYFGTLKLNFRAYHQSSERVVDPTGGGNTFLGAFAMALTKHVTPSIDVLEQLISSHNAKLSSLPDELKELVLAMIHATVAASYAIEQAGMPVLANSNSDEWNGEEYRARWERYVNREIDFVGDQLLTIINLDRS